MAPSGQPMQHSPEPRQPEPAAGSITGSLLGRRGFLRGLGGGGVAIALGAWLPRGGAYPPRKSLNVLSEKEFAILVAAAEALLADVPVSPENVAEEIDRDLAGIGDPVVADIKTVLMLLEHLTFLDGRLRRFTSLDPSSRLAYLEGWATSRFNLRRAAYHAVRTLVHFFGWARPETRPLTGFEGPWTERFDYPAYPVDFGEVT